jgi:hypothetical protein
MRTVELFEQLLLEHNVVNTEAIKRYVSNFAAQCHNENAREWFNVILARYLERDDQINVKMTDANIPRNAPDWLEDALARGDDLRVFLPPTHLNTSFDHLCDYFNFLDEQKDPIMDSRDRVMKITVQNALNKADEWTAQAAKKAAKTKVEGCKIVEVDGNYKWVQPETVQALHRDGAILHQCTANGVYDDQFRKGSMLFYILHDPKGQPHVCISVQKNGQLDQVKGKQNRPPIGRYAQLCARFLNKLQPKGLDDNHDVRMMGLVKDKDGNLVTVVEASGTCVFKIGNVRVFETAGEHARITQGGGYYDRADKIHTGIDYWFNSAEGDLFKIKVTEGRAYLNAAAVGVDAAEVRRLAQAFLNNYFADGAPPPLESAYSSATKNYLVYSEDNFRLDLRYNYLTHKYGQAFEVGEKMFEIDGCTGYKWGKTDRGLVEVEVYRGEQHLFDLPLNDNKRLKAIDWWGYLEHGDTELNRTNRKLIIDILNELELTPLNDIRAHEQNWRENAGIYYSKEKALWGTFEQTCDKVWEKGDFSLWKRHETDETKSYFMMMKKGQLLPVFELSNDARVRDDNGVVHRTEVRQSRQQRGRRRQEHDRQAAHGRAERLRSARSREGGSQERQPREPTSGTSTNTTSSSLRRRTSGKIARKAGELVPQVRRRLLLHRDQRRTDARSTTSTTARTSRCSR